MRVHKFIVKMLVPDDDQTDPLDMEEVIQGVMSGHGLADWKAGIDEMKPECRPIWVVEAVD